MAAWLPCRPPSSTACRSRRGTTCRDDCHASRIRCSSHSGAAAPASSPHGACHHGEKEQKCPWTPQVSTPTASPAPHPARASTAIDTPTDSHIADATGQTTAPWALPLRRRTAAPPHLARGRPARPRSGPAKPSHRARSSLPSRPAGSSHHAATPQQPSPSPTTPAAAPPPTTPSRGEHAPPPPSWEHAQLRRHPSGGGSAGEGAGRGSRPAAARVSFST
jgi:hypothetical protein